MFETLSCKVINQHLLIVPHSGVFVHPFADLLIKNFKSAWKRCYVMIFPTWKNVI